MKIGITYDLKSGAPPQPGQPDDLEEEFDSPTTVRAIAQCLADLGHEVVMLGNGCEMLARLLADRPDFVFNFAEGQGIGRSREARVPAVLEMLDIPHTGSDPLTLAATLDKDCAKRLVASEGIAVPRWQIFDPETELSGIAGRPCLPYTAIIKPTWEGSSKGIRGTCVVDTAAEMTATIAAHRQGYRQPIMAEEYIEGDEITVGIIGNDPPKIIGVMRVSPTEQTERFVYSLEVKRDFRRRVAYECPAQLPTSRLRAVEESALKAYHVLGCRDVARIDFRLRDGVPYFLEANPLPGLNPESSDMVILAELVGWTYQQLIGGILQAAIARTSVSPSPIGGEGLG